MRPLCYAVLLFAPAVGVAAPVKTVAELVAAVKEAKEGDTVELAAGTFELEGTLEL